MPRANSTPAPVARLWSKQAALTVAFFYATAAILMSACTVFFDDKGALRAAVFALFVEPFAHMAHIAGLAWKDPLGAGLVLLPVFFAFWPVFAYLLTRHALVCRLLALAQYALFLCGFFAAWPQARWGVFYAGAAGHARAYFLLACAVFAAAQLYFAALLVRRVLSPMTFPLQSSMEKIKTAFRWVKKNPYWSLLIAFGLYALFRAYIPGLFKWGFDKGTLGDAFGYWNSIFSGFALIGIVYSVFIQRGEFKLQREELQLQREEFKLQRKEMEESAKALKGQLDQQRKDNFEATFFRTFSILQGISEKVRLPQKLRIPEYKDPRGFDAFHRAFECFDRVYPISESNEDFLLFIDRENPLREYDEFIKNNDFFEIQYVRFSNEFGQYYCLLYNLLKMIDKADFLEDQQFYINLVRASLAKSHLLLIAINCASKQGSRKFQPLLVKWRVLKHLPLCYVQRFGFKDVYPKGIYALERWEPEED